jgi:hypothetical protein
MTSTLTARRTAADARAHWEQGKKLRESSERLLDAADAYSRLAYLHVESIMGQSAPTDDPSASRPFLLPGPASGYSPVEAFNQAHNELMSALRALRLDGPNELLPVLDKIEVRATMLRVSFTDVPPTREDFRLIAENSLHDRLPMSCNILPEVSQLVSEFTQAARAGLGHAPRDRRGPKRTPHLRKLHSRMRRPAG